MILSLFIDVKSIQDISGFNLKRMKKIARFQKTNLKTMISPLLTRPQGCQGCQKISEGHGLGLKFPYCPITVQKGLPEDNKNFWKQLMFSKVITE